MTAAFLLASMLINEPKQIPGPSDWVVWAVEHQLSLPEHLRPNYRYVAIPPWGDVSWQHSVTLALNLAASRTPLQVRPHWIANGYLGAVDLTTLATNPNHLKNLIETWDSISIDEPYVHVDSTNVINGNSQGDGGSSGVAVVPPHISPEAAQMLASLASAPVPVYRADHLMVELLDRKYYEFRGYVKDDGTLINQEELFASIGLDEDKARQINGDIRTATLHSLNTGHQRRVDVYGGLSSRYNEGRVFVTRDAVREEQDPNKLPLSNLLAFRNAAREIIYEMPNGLHGFALTDGDGNLARAADPNVAVDETVPSPYPKILSGAISCVRCHGVNSGLQPIKHDLAKILDSGANLIFDVSDTNLTQAEAIERINALYRSPEVVDKKIQRSREDINDAVFLLTDGYYVKPDDPYSVPRAFAAIAKIHDDYRYKLVTPRQALLELGFETTKEEDELRHLATVLGPSASEVSPTEAALRSGLPVLRSDFEVAYLDLAVKAKQFKEKTK